MGEQGRWYEKGGKRYVSVTTVSPVSFGLCNWYGNEGVVKLALAMDIVKEQAPIMFKHLQDVFPQEFWMGPQEQSNVAKNIGSAAHSYFDRWLKGDYWNIQDVPEDVRPCCRNFLAAFDGKEYKVKFVEKTVFSDRHMYAGTLDAVLEMDGRLVLCDWKTSKSLQDFASCQVVAYKEALSEELGHNVDDCEIYRFDKTGKKWNPKTDFHRVPREHHEYLLKKFLACFEVWKWQNRVDVPKVGVLA